MNQLNVGEDAQELQLRARIMELRTTVRDLERPENAELGRGLGPLEALFLDGLQHGLNRERRELNNLERFHRATYPNLLERIDIEDEIHDFQEYLIDLEYLIARNERIRHLQGLGELPPNIPEVPFNPVEEPPNPPAVEPQNARRNRRRRWEEMRMQHQAMEALEPPAIRDFPVAEAQGNPVIAPQQLGDQEFVEQFQAWERRAQRQAAEMNAVPADFIQVIRVEHRQNQDEPRQEDQEGPENRNPEEPRQEEGPENKEDPENEPQILLDGRRPAVAAPEAPVVEGPALEEQREVVGPEGPHKAQAGEQPVPNVFFIPPERRVEEGPENQGEPDNQPQN
ncbi:Protein CBG17792 [Caenorhabditis briggsae]|uniref:Uncharacterized protein n=2 Tax=Caenorhabditis briggsae TaxID=6238 RepID=A0AAE9EIK6_CAEBR|nr:Protein CBG17792 [Caenorhabditis briggsae]ULU08026.1 hypothetical protein L3Y34_019239 [Caenorhabditis briggsae]UMM19961.1 hypothetical protein L5515_015361 [Caenorhabditis briggsae]CAP35359.1 Protein CBG17792 [Caenorhabditis briggsae]